MDNLFSSFHDFLTFLMCHLIDGVISVEASETLRREKLVEKV